MLLIQRMFGKSLQGYDPASDGEDYHHEKWLAEQDKCDDAEDEGEMRCFVKTTLQRCSSAKTDSEWSCDGDIRLVGELFCRKCMDHFD